MNDPFVGHHQEYEKSVDLCWMLGWRAYEFGILKQKETRPGMQLEWTVANPLQSHNHEQASELNPKTQPAEQEACRLAQSGAINEKKTMWN